MRSVKRLGLVLFIALLPLGCVSTQPAGSSASFPLTIYDDNSGIWVPADPASSGDGTGRLPQADRLTYQALGPYPLALNKLPPQAVGPDLSGMIPLQDKGRIEKPIPEEAAEKLRAKALLLPPTAMVQRANEASGPGPQSPASGGAGFDSLDYTDCCGSGGNVPADSELAVGPNHIIAVVNVAFEIYDKSGNLLQGPTTFASFFAGVPNCSSVFDPNVIYDEKEDRFILAIDGNGTDYCVAASQTGDPKGTWNRYSFATDVGRNFFDYPHAGVGDDAIYLGANLFGRRSFVEGRVWAIDKDALYSGSTLTVKTHSTGGESTPQPMNLHGWSQGTWPSPGAPHYFLTDGPYDGARYGVWSWVAPFGADTLINKGTVNLNSFTGVTAGAPIDAVQLEGNPKLDGNDWRVQDAEFRNGDIWMADTIACNPGAGTVDCVRWAQIDPAGPAVIDAGVYGSDGQYRIFADLAADDCGNMAIGYTKTSSSIYPSVFVTGRESTDAGGTLQSEVSVKQGAIHYTSFQSGTTHRWGDYTAMTIDPDGRTFWYMGQYSKNTGTTNGRWANWIAPFSFASCGGGGGGNTPPSAAFSYGCAGLSCSFTNSSSDPDGFIASSSWDFGDGGTSALDSPSHTYGADGTYTAKLTVTDNGGLTDAISKNVAVSAPPTNNPPIASFSYSCTDLSCNFTDTSTDPDGTINSRAWTFGDGGTSTGSTPLHTYAAGGTYDVILTVNDNDGASDADTQSLTVTGGSGSTLVASSTNNGKTWTAIVTDTDTGHGDLQGTWSSSGGSCSGHICSLPGIPKKQASVIFTATAPTSEEITVLK